MTAQLASPAIARNRRLGLVLALVAAGMVGAAFAAVPLYRLFCQVTGFGGTTQVASEAPGATSERLVTVRFDASVAGDLPWVFTAPGPVTVRLGEEGEASYFARNTGSQLVLGTSTFNVTPLKTGKYFQKIECFCFTEQLLQPGQSEEFRVTFFVDPALADDPNTAEVSTITLSYTFFDAGAEALERYVQKNPDLVVTNQAPEPRKPQP